MHLRTPPMTQSRRAAEDDAEVSLAVPSRGLCAFVPLRLKEANGGSSA